MHDEHVFIVHYFGGRPSRDRTCDPRIKSPLLYRLSYRPENLCSITFRKIALQIRKASVKMRSYFG